MDKDKIKCEECGWSGHNKKADKIKDPKSDMTWIVCPNCRIPEHLICLCDEDKCWRETTCGTPTKNGYRHTCGEHKPKKGE